MTQEEIIKRQCSLLGISTCCPRPSWKEGDIYLDIETNLLNIYSNGEWIVVEDILTSLDYFTKKFEKESRFSQIAKEIDNE